MLASQIGRGGESLKTRLPTDFPKSIRSFPAFDLDFIDLRQFFTCSRSAKDYLRQARRSRIDLRLRRWHFARRCKGDLDGQSSPARHRNRICDIGRSLDVSI